MASNERVVALQKIICGGQTGADQGGLDAARELGLATGGTAALGWATEVGPAPWLAQFGLLECDRPGYPERTRANVANADATLIFANQLDGGSRLTVESAIARGKPHLVVAVGEKAAARRIRDWLDATQPRVVNVAGHRESKCPGIRDWVRGVLVSAVVEDGTRRSG